MSYHLTDIFVKTSRNYHFCPIVFRLKFAFTYSTNIILWKQTLQRTKHALFYVIKLKLQKKKVKCDWMSLFNTNKKFQIN